jgi:hypothetical protein
MRTSGNNGGASPWPSEIWEVTVLATSLRAPNTVQGTKAARVGGNRRTLNPRGYKDEAAVGERMPAKSSEMDRCVVDIHLVSPSRPAQLPGFRRVDMNGSPLLCSGEWAGRSKWLWTARYRSRRDVDRCCSGCNYKVYLRCGGQFAGGCVAFFVKRRKNVRRIWIVALCDGRKSGAFVRLRSSRTNDQE